MADLPVVMMTSSPGVVESDVAGLEHLGVTGLFRKPVSAEELAEILSRHLPRSATDKKSG